MGIMGLGRVGAAAVAVALFCGGPSAAQSASMDEAIENAIDVSIDARAHVGEDLVIACPVAEARSDGLVCKIPNGQGKYVGINSVQIDLLRACSKKD